MSDRELRDKLLELETITPELEDKYRNEMKGILERPLTPVSRIAYVVALLMGIGFFLLFSTIAIVGAAVVLTFLLLGWSHIGVSVSVIVGLVAGWLIGK